MKPMVCAIVAAVCSACTAGVHVHDGGGGAGGGGGPPPGGDSGVSPDGGPGGKPAVDGRPGPLPNPEGRPIACNKPQYILILDFRSGWWNGSGGGGASFMSPPTGPGGPVPTPPRNDGFSVAIFPLIAEACPGTRIEYHHILADPWGVVACNYPVKNGGPMCVASPRVADVKFGESDWNSYSQIWVLSGSEKDVSDVTAASAIFGDIIKASQSSCLPFFIGLGSGFVDHGNAAAELLGIGRVAVTTLAKPNFWIYRIDAAATSTMERNKLVSHPLFSGVDSVADVVKHDVGNDVVEGDALIDNPLVTVVARDNANRPSIGHGRVAATKDLRWGRPFVLDAGMQRFYVADKPDHRGTLIYLQNLVNYLGSVGCKSDEPPIIVQ